MNLTVREVFDRYGPALAVMAMLALLVAVVPGNADGGSAQELSTAATESGDPSSTGFAGSDPGATGFSGSETGTSAAGSDTSVAVGAGGGRASGSGGGATSGSGGTTSASGGATGSGGTAGATTTGGGGAPSAGADCRADGAVDAFSPYAPECVPLFTGDNGGDVYPGVSADTIKVVYYFPQQSAATSATLQAIGADDPRPQEINRAKVLARYFNTHYETYGRAVELTIFESSADSDDEAALRADAVKIANEIGPFAVIGAGDVVAAELAARGILCMCTTSEPSGYYQQHAPHVYQILPEAEEYYQHLAEYIGKRLANKPAEHAGTNVGLDLSKRKFGLIYIEGTGNKIDPRADDAEAYFEQQLAKYGVKLTHVVAYTYDAAQGQSQATNIMAQMKSEGVTTVACACDPIYPIFFTQVSTQQQYFPEWLIVGTALTDTTFFGRTYDQQQWRNAFGISPLPIPATDLSTTHPYKEFHHMVDAEDGDEGTQILVDEPAFSLLFAGIHNAGPNLTPQTFAQGLWDAPSTGGQLGTVTVKYTPESYAAIKDFNEIWWDPQGTGKDEVGNDGAGIMLKTMQGKRFLAGQWPAGDPNVFNREGTIYTVDDPPVHDHDADGHTHSPDERCRSCR